MTMLFNLLIIQVLW